MTRLADLITIRGYMNGSVVKQRALTVATGAEALRSSPKTKMLIKALQPTEYNTHLVPRQRGQDAGLGARSITIYCNYGVM